MEKEFVALVVDGGAFKKLARAVNEIREIVSPYIKGDDKIQRLGHCGIPGEFLNGIGHATNYYKLHLASPERYTLGSCVENLFEIFNRPSQLAQSKPAIAGKLKDNETSGEAIPRAINDLREWKENCEALTTEDATALDGLLEECATQFEVIKAFVKKHAPGPG